jgi:hypothetical protein
MEGAQPTAVAGEDCGGEMNAFRCLISLSLS